MRLIEIQNDYEFDIYIEESYDVVFIKTKPDLIGTVFFKSLNGGFIYYENIKFSEENLFFAKYDDNIMMIEIFKDDELLLKKIIFRELERPLINKDDITIVVDILLNLEIIKCYNKFGNVVTGTFDDKYITKYTIYLKNYLINISHLINKMFFNKGKILKDKDNNVCIIENENINSNIIVIDDLKIINLDILF